MDEVVNVYLGPDETRYKRLEDCSSLFNSLLRVASTLLF